MGWKPIKYHWHLQLKSTPADLWAYIADTQRFNQAAALPNIAYDEEPLDIGGSRRIGRTSKFGIIAEFEDFPFDWVREQGFSNLRVFRRGPLAQTYAVVRLRPNDQGTLLEYKADITPANLLGWLGIPYQFGWESRRNFGRAFRQIDDYLQQRVEQPFDLKVTNLSGSGQKRLENLAKQLADEGYELRWIQHLADMMLTEADLNLRRIRPYVLADQWQAPRQNILNLFLSGAKLGMFNMQWDVMCPFCRGDKATASSLDEVRKGVHCSTCNIDFEADFSRNVELTFTPHPQIRPVENHTYCIGGPMVTPHILIHQTLGPGETRTVQAALAPQGYRFRTQRPGVEQWLTLEAEQLRTMDTLTIKAGDDFITVTPLAYEAKLSPQQSTDMKLVLTNHATYVQRIYIEQSAWYTDAVTAAQVTTLQHFRDLFSDEVLRPGEEIGVQGMTILFSDLVGSTAMYNQRGDAPSYALVREQFAFLQGIIREQQGAIVKTIGDAIMAAFADPANGVVAALAIQKEINHFNTVHADNPLTIKLGLHYGPCIAVNLNGRLDYFGTTVNLAARLEGQSRGGDVIISEKMYKDPAVTKLLTTQPVEAIPFKTSIKGFDDSFQLYRLTWL